MTVRAGVQLLYDHVLRAEGLTPSRRGLPVALPSTSVAAVSRPSTHQLNGT